MPTEISGHYIPAVRFNLEDVLAASRDPEHGWVVDMIDRGNIAAAPEHHERLAAFAAEHFFPAKDGLWINPKPLLYMGLNEGKLILDAGQGLLTYDASHVDVARLAQVAGLTLVGDNSYVQLSVARSLGSDMLFFGIGECVDITPAFRTGLCEVLKAAGWVQYKGGTLVNPVTLAVREGELVIDNSGTRSLLAWFNDEARATIDALPWETRGSRQINYLALKNVEPYRNLISPRVRELCDELLAA